MTPEELQEKYPLPDGYEWAPAIIPRDISYPGIRNKNTGWWCVWCYDNKNGPDEGRGKYVVHIFTGDEMYHGSCEADSPEDRAAHVHHLFLFVYEERSQR